MKAENPDRAALLAAAEKLLAGDIAGPLTGVRLVEVAGVKRHRLTHDNPDIAADFRERAQQLNRNQPAVEKLRAELRSRRTRNSELIAEVAELRERLARYATRIDELVVERALLLDALQRKNNVAVLPRKRD